MHFNMSQFSKQTHQWVTLIEGFNGALKQIGDLENWSRIIESDMKFIAETLEHTYNGMVWLLDIGLWNIFIYAVEICVIFVSTESFVFRRHARRMSMVVLKKTMNLFVWIQLVPSQLKTCLRFCQFIVLEVCIDQCYINMSFVMWEVKVSLYSLK